MLLYVFTEESTKQTIMYAISLIGISFTLLVTHLRTWEEAKLLKQVAIIKKPWMEKESQACGIDHMTKYTVIKLQEALKYNVGRWQEARDL